METPPDHVPPTTETIFRSLLRTLGLVERVMQPYFARFGISGAQWGVLRNLYRAEEAGQASLRLTDLGERLLIKPPSVTGLVNRLVTSGLVTCVRSAADRRAREVALSATGRRLVQRVLTRHAEQQALVLAGLDAEQQQHLHGLMTQLGRHLETLTEEREPAQAG
jgi:DNA-binding MarR family transcriptional regulator